MSETPNEAAARERDEHGSVRMPRPGVETLRAIGACLWPIEWPTALAAAVAALLPAVALRFHGPLLWIAGTLLVVVALEHSGAVIRPVSLRLAVVVLAVGAVYAGNILLGVSYFLQRRGFNDIFFANLNLNVADAIPIYGTEAALVVGYSVVGLTIALLAARRLAPRPFSWPLGAVTLTAVLLFTPTFQLLAHRVTRSLDARTPHDLASLLPPAQPRPSPIPSAPARLHPSPAPRTPASVPGTGDGSDARATADPDADRPSEPSHRNLVLIYLEGLEQAILDVPGLMPRLAALRRGMFRFTNVRCTVGFTIGGIVSSQCGWPPNTGQELYEAKTFYPGLLCLGDELKRHGYHNTYMGGGSIRFTRYDTFFGTHGFAEALGEEALLPMTPDPTYRNKWGLEDDALFALARAKFETLAGASAPFTLALLTMDTHVPYFVSKSCTSYAASADPMLQAAHCTDQIVGDFVDFVHASAVANQTVIALVSDHLLWGGIADHGLQIPDDDRRLTFLLEVPGSTPREVAVSGTEFDVGPTLADALGVGLTDPGRIGLGSSLLVGDGFLWTPASGLPSDFHAIYAFTHSDTVRAFVDAAR
jgi:hypothetical protein